MENTDNISFQNITYVIVKPRYAHVTASDVRCEWALTAKHA